MTFFLTVVFKPLFAVVFIISHIPALLWLSRKAGEGTDSFLVVAAIMSGIFVGLVSTIVYSHDRSTPLAIALIGLSLTGSLLNVSTINFMQFNVMFLIVGLYGIVGLSFATQQEWRRVAGVVLLTSLVLPFYLEFSSGFGFSLRLLTAALIENLLQGVGYTTISSHDIILSENAIAHIDVPCSGLKSLCFGNIFFLIFVVLFRAQLSWRLLFPYAVMMFLLISFNMARVLILTLLTVVYKQPDIAEMVHVPLGVLGFGGSCLAAGWMLSHSFFRFQPATSLSLTSVPYKSVALPLLTLLSIALATTNFAKGSPNVTQKPQPLSPPQLLNPTYVSLNSGERKYFSNGKLTVANKWMINHQGRKGSLLLVRSRDFNKFHAPELCMAVHGISIDHMKTIQISKGLKARIISLNGGKQTGIYWLQSGAETTDSFTERHWRFIWEKKNDWSMVSMIIDTPFQSDTQLINKISTTLYAALSEK